MTKPIASPEGLRVLVLTPTGQDAALIERTLMTAGFTCLICRSVRDVVDALAVGAGALLVAQEAIQSRTVGALVTALSDQPPWSDIPVTLLTASGAGRQAVHQVAQQIERVGNLTILERPLQQFTLVSVLRAALRSRSRQYEVRDLVARLEASQSKLHEKINDLEHFQDVVVGRELKMIELEKQLKEYQGRARSIKENE